MPEGKLHVPFVISVYFYVMCRYSIATVSLSPHGLAAFLQVTIKID